METHNADVNVEGLISGLDLCSDDIQVYNTLMSNSVWVAIIVSGGLYTVEFVGYVTLIYTTFGQNDIATLIHTIFMLIN